MSDVLRLKQIYEGKAKIVFEGENENEVIMQFKNSLTAFDGVKKAELEGKGELNWKISGLLLPFLAKNGIPTHLIKILDDRMHECQKVQIYPIEVVCRNKSAGSFCRRYGVEEGKKFDVPLIEFFYKNDALHDPVFSDEIIQIMNLATENELATLRYYCLLINHYLKELFLKGNLELVDFKLEFGKNTEGKIVLADEITPDTMRLWKIGETDLAEKVLDKDRFRRDLGPVDYGYKQILYFLEKANLSNLSLTPPKVKIQVNIHLKQSISDAAGDTTLLALNRSNLHFTNVRIGKSIHLEHDGFISPLKVEETTQTLLTNPLIENFSISYTMVE